MDSGNTNNINDENINHNLNNTAEDLTNVFDTPVDLNVTNLGVGETTTEYNKEDTEILDLYPINEFKEAEIKVESSEVESEVINEPVINIESNPFELNDSVNENFDLVQETEVFNNSAEVAYTPSSVDNLTPVSLDNLNNNESEAILTNEGESSNKAEETSVVEQPVIESEQIAIQQEVQNVNIESNVNTPSTFEKSNASEPEVIIKKKKNIFPIIIVLCIVGVLGALVATYFLIFTTPKNIFNKALDNGIKYLNNSMVEAGKYDTIVGNGSLSYELKAEDSNVQSMLDVFNDISLNYEYGIDYKNKLVNFNIDSTYKNEKLLDVDLYTENSKAYLLFVDIYNTYIASPIEGYDSIFNTDINQKELTTVLDSFKVALSKSLTDEDFVKSEELIKINGMEVKVTKNSFVLNDKNVNRISKSVLTILKDDADFISAINKLSNDETVDAKALLESAIENISDVSSGDNTVIAFSIYTKGFLNEVVGFSAEVKSTETIKLFITKSVGAYSYVITKGSEELVNGIVRTTGIPTNSNSQLVLNIKNVGSVKIDVAHKAKYNIPLNKPNISNNIAIEQLPQNWVSNIVTAAMKNPGFAKLITNIQMMNGSMNGSNGEIVDNQGQSNISNNGTTQTQVGANSYNNTGI